MNNNDADLFELFANSPEHNGSEAIIQNVSKKIEELRIYKRIWRIVIIIAGLGIAAALLPIFAVFSSRLAEGTNFIAPVFTTILLSPVGWVICGGLCLTYFLKLRA